MLLASPPVLMDGERSPAGSSSLRVSQECGSTTAIALCFYKLKQLGKTVMARSAVRGAFLVRSRRRFLHVCPRRHRKLLRHVSNPDGFAA